MPEPTKTKSTVSMKFKDEDEKFTDLHHNLAASSTQHPLSILTYRSVMQTIEKDYHLPGVAIPPAAKFTTGRCFNLAVSLRRWKGA